MVTSKTAMWVCPRCRAAFLDGFFCPFDGEPLAIALHLERELGRGLTGTVWQGRTVDAAPVAVKVLHREWADHGEMRERFVREARAAAAIRHPLVVAPCASGELADGRPFLVMELVDGPALEDVLEVGALPERRALAIAADLAGALAAVHQAGIVHRDVKPANVKIGRDGRARLFDFGVARRLDADEPRLTHGGLTVGTPHYMSPEQCSGDPTTGRADVYALGVVLFRMITGDVPFDGPAVAVMLAHATRAPRPASDLAPVSAALDRLITRCLAKRASDRPSAAELAAALAQLAARADADRPAPAMPTPTANAIARVRPRRSPGAWLGAAVALAILVLVVNATGPGHDLAHRIGVHFHPDVPLLRGPMPQAAAMVAPPPVDPAALPAADEARQYLIASDAGVALRLGAPVAIGSGREVELTIEAWDADGEPIATTDLVVTFAGPGGAVVGLAAEPTLARGLYRARTRFDVQGAWTVRVFPPIGESMVTFHVEVGGIPST
jgi:hypothetical protein